MEDEKKMRREIANSNERRRMQSINAGFNALRNLLPKHEGEKLSKAAILQQTAEYIYALEQEKTRLLAQNSQLKRLLSEHEGVDAPPKRRKQETQDMRDVAEEEAALKSAVALDRLERCRTLPYLDEYDPADLPPDDDLVDERLVPIDLPRPLLEEETLSRPASPPPDEDAPPLTAVAEQTLLEAAIKAEPKVEVEPIPSSPGEPSRLFIANTSRQNLETIVEAIRHLEGDHMFAEEQPGREQESPLALTNKPDQRRLLTDLLQFHRPQSRPGVIVVKHS